MEKLVELDLLEFLPHIIPDVKVDPKFDIPVYDKKKDRKKKTVLVFSGGGIKGVAHIGVLKGLDELGYLNNFDTFAGASVGSLILALYLVGYTPDELKEFILKFDLGRMKSINIFGILESFGLDSGKKFQYVLERLISAKNVDPNITLKELHEKVGKTFYFTTVCLNTHTVEYLSHEKYPDLPLITALRMTSAIPWFYTPVQYKGRLYVDGGCIDNYPINLFKDRLDDVMGFYITETNDVVDKIDNLEVATLRIFQCFMEGVNFNSKKGFEKYTIDVNMESISIINYELDEKKKMELFKVGYDTILNIFSN